MLTDAHDAGQLRFFNTHAGLADAAAFAEKAEEMYERPLDPAA